MPSLPRLDLSADHLALVEVNAAAAADWLSEYPYVKVPAAVVGEIETCLRTGVPELLSEVAQHVLAAANTEMTSRDIFSTAAPLAHGQAVIERTDLEALRRAVNADIEDELRHTLGDLMQDSLAATAKIRHNNNEMSNNFDIAGRYELILLAYQPLWNEIKGAGAVTAEQVRMWNAFVIEFHTNRVSSALNYRVDSTDPRPPQLTPDNQAALDALVEARPQLRSGLRYLGLSVPPAGPELV